MELCVFLTHRYHWLWEGIESDIFNNMSKLESEKMRST